MKFDGVGFAKGNDKLTPVLIEFSGGIKYSTTEDKNSLDLNQLATGSIKAIEYITASIALPLPLYSVGFHEASIYFESILKLTETIYVRRTYTSVPVPSKANLLKDFFTKTSDMCQWRNAVISA